MNLKPRPSVMIQARIQAELSDAITEVANNLDTTKSYIIRSILKQWFNDVYKNQKNHAINENQSQISKDFLNNSK